MNNNPSTSQSPLPWRYSPEDQFIYAANGVPVARMCIPLAGRAGQPTKAKIAERKSNTEAILLTMHENQALRDALALVLKKLALSDPKEAIDIIPKIFGVSFTEFFKDAKPIS